MDYTNSSPALCVYLMDVRSTAMMCANRGGGSLGDKAIIVMHNYIYYSHSVQ